MPERYIALLRGINVGNNLLKMERLREVWAELGFENTRTYIQSGNVVFDGDGSPKVWVEKIVRRLASECRLPVSVVVRSATDLAEIIASNPFLAKKGIDSSKLHVTFLAGAPSSGGAVKLGDVKSGRDQFQVVGEEVFLYCPDGYGISKLTNNVIEKVLGVRATTRNWRTVLKLGEMISEV